MFYRELSNDYFLITLIAAFFKLCVNRVLTHIVSAGTLCRELCKNGWTD